MNYISRSKINYIYIGNKNITCKCYNTDRLLIWRLILFEYSLEIEYTTGGGIIAADAISQFTNGKNQQTTHASDYSIENMSEVYDTNEFPEGKFLITFNIINLYQY